MRSPGYARPAAQVAYFHTLGMSKRDIVNLSKKREQLFYLSLPTIRSKLMFLQEVVGAHLPAPPGTSAEPARPLLGASAPTLWARSCRTLPAARRPTGLHSCCEERA